MQNYQGAVDLMVAILSRPSSATSQFVKLVSKKQSPRHRVIVRALDRERWNTPTGNYFFCGKAYSDSSAVAKVTESTTFQNTFEAESDLLYSFWLYQNDSLNFRANQATLRTQSF